MHLWFSRKNFIIEMVTVWQYDWLNWMMKKYFFYLNSTLSIYIYVCWRILITENCDILNYAIFSPNVHWWADQARSMLLRSQTLCIFEFINQFTDDHLCHYMIHTRRYYASQMNINSMVGVTKLTRFRSFICCCYSSNFRLLIRDNREWSV